MGGILDFIQHNLAHVAPILVMGAIGLIIILERGLFLSFGYPMKRPKAFYEKVRNLVLNEKISEAIAFCDRYRSKPIACVVKEGLLRAHQPEGLIQHGLEIAVGEAQQRIQSRTNFLAMIANVATLLGLFGTILGLIQSFEAVGHADPQQKSALLAAGISTAMNATMLGLAVAIPCMIAFSVLVTKTNRLNVEIEHSAIRVLDFVKQRYYAAAPPEDSAPSAIGNPSSRASAARHA